MANSEEIKKTTKALQDQLNLLEQTENTFESIAGIISGNLSELTKSNEARRIALSEARKLRSISEKIAANESATDKLSSSQLRTLQSRAAESKKILDANIKNGGVTKSERASLRDISNQSKELVELAGKRAEKEAEIEQKGGLLLNSLKGIEKVLSKAGFGDLSKKLKLKETLRESENSLDAFKNISTNIAKSISTGDVLAFTFKKIGEAALRADTNIANLRRNFGVSFNEGRKLNDEFVKIAVSTSDITANVENLTEANQNINQQLGIQTQYTDELLIAANALVQRNKLSAEAAAGFSQQVLATGIGAEVLLDTSAQTVAEIQNQTGVQLSFNSVLEGANKISGQLRANLLRTPDGLVKAVATAKTLGVELSDITGIAGQLLDFESSITKELEAELLLGRDLNLEQARLLALNGKTDEAVASLVSQIGTLNEFQQLNVIQQQALASAVGMTSDQLATTLEKQSAINSQKKEGLDIEAESMKAGASALSTQEKLASAVEKLNSVLQGTLVIFGALAGLAAFALAPVTGGLSLAAFATGGAALGFGAQAVFDGIAPSNRGPFTITDRFGATAITANGDGVAVSPNISQGSSSSEAKRTNMLLEQILNKQGTVKIDSVQAGTAFSMGTYQVQ